MKDPRLRMLIRNFAIEVLLYTVLVVVYFFLVLRFLGGPLEELFADNRILYAFVALGMIVVQGAVLEWITSFLITRLGLERLE